ncbi:putative invertase inhibitor [Neltuma alba]|uniref:putative invertase inhibitor n=1 Tax=Neltuma alba TaxID=207710 RepID=UPI0010A3DD42|nr:putative invertase inhibitor [Prosopis alba]
MTLYPSSFVVLLILFQASNGCDFIRESCTKASENDPIVHYDFCVASLEAVISQSNPPTSLGDLVAMSIQITKSNATDIVSTISDLLKEPNQFSEYAKECLKDCSDLYSDSLADLDDAMGAFESQDFNTASMKVSAAMEASVTCENQFTDGNEESPLTEHDKTYFELNAMSLAFIKIHQ